MKTSLLLAASAALAVVLAAPSGVSSANANGFGPPQEACPIKKKKPVCHTKKRPAAPVVKQVIVAPQPTPTIAVPGPGPAPMVFVYGDPWAMQMANDGCPMVNDALLLQQYPDGQTRYRWRGTDWAFLPPKPEGQARICTRNGRLAWWTPPKPRPLNGPAAPATPAPTPQQQGMLPGEPPAFYAQR